jgi:hypothetical protein
MMFYVVITLDVRSSGIHISTTGAEVVNLVRAELNATLVGAIHGVALKTGLGSGDVVTEGVHVGVLLSKLETGGLLADCRGVSRGDTLVLVRNGKIRRDGIRNILANLVHILVGLIIGNLVGLDGLNIGSVNHILETLATSIDISAIEDEESHKKKHDRDGGNLGSIENNCKSNKNNEDSIVVHHGYF